jgi:thymidylate kinase
MNPRLIIVEGPDCVGKTTFVRNLAATIRLQYLRVTMTMRTTCSKALIPGMLDYQTALMKDVSENIAAGYLVILDRSWPSDAVYQPILRPKTPSCVTEVKLMVEQFKPVYIFIERADVIEAHTKEKNKAHPYGKREFTKIVKAYKELAESMYGDFFYRERTMILDYDEIIDDLTPIVARLFPKQVPQIVDRYLSRPEYKDSQVIPPPFGRSEPMLIIQDTSSHVVPTEEDPEDKRARENLERMAREEKAELRRGPSRGSTWEEGVDPVPPEVGSVPTEETAEV